MKLKFVDIETWHHKNDQREVICINLIQLDLDAEIATVTLEKPREWGMDRRFMSIILRSDFTYIILFLDA